MRGSWEEQQMERAIPPAATTDRQLPSTINSRSVEDQLATENRQSSEAVSTDGEPCPSPVSLHHLLCGRRMRKSWKVRRGLAHTFCSHTGVQTSRSHTAGS